MQDPRFGRGRAGWTLRAVLVAMLAIAVTSSGVSAAHAANTYPTLDVVNVRVSPNTQAVVMYQVPKGQRVSIDCYVIGEQVSGTKVWNRLASGGYITDSLLLTGSDDPVVPKCRATSTKSSDPATCYAEGCDGLDPQATTCVQDARILKSWKARVGDHNYGRFEMRYSPKCHSNWVRFIPTQGMTGLLGNLTGGIVNSSPKIWRDGVGGSERGLGGMTDPSMWADTTTWSQMITADGKTCGSVTLSGTERSDYGGGDTYELGTFKSPCIS